MKKPLELTRDEAAELFDKGVVSAWRSEVANTNSGDKMLVKNPARVSESPAEAEVKDASTKFKNGIKGILMSIGLT